MYMTINVTLCTSTSTLQLTMAAWLCWLRYDLLIVDLFINNIQ